MTDKFDSRRIARLFDVPPWLIDPSIRAPWWHRASVWVYWARGLLSNWRKVKT